jgi:hypothetical protein
VEVVEGEDERCRLRELFEQRAHRAVASIALVLQPGLPAAGEWSERREHMCELCLHVVVER